MIQKKILMIQLILVCYGCFSVFVYSQTTSFVYQGNLSISGSPANGIFSMQFSLWDASSDGNQIGTTTSQNVTVTNGVFSIVLDYGAEAFPGSDRFLQVIANSTTFPRIPLTSTPYAIRALTVTGPITDVSLGSVLTVTNIAGGISDPSPSNLPPTALTGRASDTSAVTAGLTGISDSQGGIGVIGMSTTDAPTQSTSAFMALARTGANLFNGVNSSTGNAMFVADASGNVRVAGNLQAGTIAVQGGPNTIQGGLAVTGTLNVNGNLAVNGSKSSVARLDDGTSVLLYAVESPENWFEDLGSVRLHNGRAWVPIESKFAQTVNLSIPYKVFLTPNGNCRGLYVARKTPNGFEVRELGGGRSNVVLDYRIVAKRSNFEDKRLEPITVTSDSDRK